MDRHMITPSLYDAWYYFQNSETDNLEEFLNTLRKIKTPPSDAMVKGIEFEDRVREATEGRFVPGDLPNKYIDCVREVADMVSGCLWQERVHKEIYISGRPYLLYGKADCMKRDWVYDIKYTGSYEIGKYNPKLQHHTYMSCSGLQKFRYVITDEKSVYCEDYFWEPDSENILMGNLRNMMEHIMSDVRFRELFTLNWKTQY